MYHKKKRKLQKSAGQTHAVRQRDPKLKGMVSPSPCGRGKATLALQLHIAQSRFPIEKDGFTLLGVVQGR